MSDNPEGRRASYTITQMSTVGDNVDEHLAAIDNLVRDLQAATATYRGRPLDWVDIAFLRQVRSHLSGAVTGFNSAEASAELIRASRQVATEVRQFRVGVR